MGCSSSKAAENAVYVDPLPPRTVSAASEPQPKVAQDVSDAATLPEASESATDQTEKTYHDPVFAPQASSAQDADAVAVSPVAPADSVPESATGQKDETSSNPVPAETSAQEAGDVVAALDSAPDTDPVPAEASAQRAADVAAMPESAPETAQAGSDMQQSTYVTHVVEGEVPPQDWAQLDVLAARDLPSVEEFRGAGGASAARQCRFDCSELSRNDFAMLAHKRLVLVEARLAEVQPKSVLTYTYTYIQSGSDDAYICISIYLYLSLV